MPQDATTHGLEPGTVAEVRVARAWFWDGYYVRRGVDLQHRFGADVSTVTDLDVLGYSFDEALHHRKLVGEVKTGRSGSTPRPLDRALWIRGVREIVGAEAGEITTAFRTSNTARDVCSRLGVKIQHLDDLAAREERLHISEVNEVGAQGESMAALRERVRIFVKRDPILERGFFFLVSEVWFLDPFDALKRTLGLIRELSKVWPESSHVEALEAARWIFAEAISIAVLNLTIVTGESLTMDSKQFAESASARLATGDVPYHSLHAISERVDEYVGKLLTALDAPPEVRVGAMGAFLPTPPEYASPLLELIDRLAVEAKATSRLPRQVDAVIFEHLVRRRPISPRVAARLGLNRHSQRHFGLVAAFLRGQFDIPGEVDRALTYDFQQPRLFASDQDVLPLLDDKD